MYWLCQDFIFRICWPLFDSLKHYVSLELFVPWKLCRAHLIYRTVCDWCLLWREFLKYWIHALPGHRLISFWSILFIVQGIYVFCMSFFHYWHEFFKWYSLITFRSLLLQYRVMAIFIPKVVCLFLLTLILDLSWGGVSVLLGFSKK